MNLNITAETTEAKITSAAIAARQALAAKATEAADESSSNPEEFYLQGEALLGLAQNVASAESLMRVQLQYLRVCKNRPEERMNFLFDAISRGADDSWSGRRNDSARSNFDAIRSWAVSQADRFRYED